MAQRGVRQRGTGNAGIAMSQEMMACNRSITPRAAGTWLRRLRPCGDELGQGGNAWLIRSREPAAEVVTERDALLSTGLRQPEEGVPAVAAEVAACAAADLSSGNMASKSFSDPLVWSEISGCTSTASSSALLAYRRCSGRSRVAKPARCFPYSRRKVSNRRSQVPLSAMTKFRPLCRARQMAICRGRVRSSVG